MILLKRDWRVQIDTQVFTGHAVSFDITKSTKREPNTCTVKVLNLSADQRQAIQALSLKKKKSGTQSGQIRVAVEAGYVGARSLLFRGDLRTAESVREGATWTTTVEGEDGGRSILQARVNQSFPAGTPVVSVVRACAKALGLGLGNTDELTAAAQTRGGSTFTGGTVLSGKAEQELTHILLSCGLTWSVQQGNVQILRAGAALSTNVVHLAEGTGLVDSPVVNPDGSVSARALLVPGLFPGGRVAITSSTAKGTYTIKEMQSTGESEGQDWYHDLELKV